MFKKKKKKERKENPETPVFEDQDQAKPKPSRQADGKPSLQNHFAKQTPSCGNVHIHEQERVGVRTRLQPLGLAWTSRD